MNALLLCRTAKHNANNLEDRGLGAVLEIEAQLPGALEKSLDALGLRIVLNRRRLRLVGSAHPRERRKDVARADYRIAVDVQEGEDDLQSFLRGTRQKQADSLDVDSRSEFRLREAEISSEPVDVSRWKLAPPMASEVGPRQCHLIPLELFALIVHGIRCARHLPKDALDLVPLRSFEIACTLQQLVGYVVRLLIGLSLGQQPLATRVVARPSFAADDALDGVHHGCWNFRYNIDSDVLFSRRGYRLALRRGQLCQSRSETSLYPRPVLLGGPAGRGWRRGVQRGSRCGGPPEELIGAQRSGHRLRACPLLLVAAGLRPTRRAPKGLLWAVRTVALGLAEDGRELGAARPTVGRTKEHGTQLRTAGADPEAASSLQRWDGRVPMACRLLLEGRAGTQPRRLREARPPSPPRGRLQELRRCLRTAVAGRLRSARVPGLGNGVFRIRH
mmetsp:Transcript_86058/g.277978  ORF Transcript_86058/g.277978 Transcript_86058/m.277978 type:complete len:446 (+) Transcript_86058:2213-3550(+)